VAYRGSSWDLWFGSAIFENIELQVRFWGGSGLNQSSAICIHSISPNGPSVSKVQREEIYQGRFLFYLDLSNSKVDIFTLTDDLPTISELEVFECPLTDDKNFDDATSRLSRLNSAYGTRVVWRSNSYRWSIVGPTARVSCGFNRIHDLKSQGALLRPMRAMTTGKVVKKHETDTRQIFYRYSNA